MDFDKDGGDSIVSNIQHNIRSLNEQVSTLESWIGQLTDSSSSGERTREQFNEKAQQAQQLGKETNQLMKQLVDRSNNDRALRIHRERLSNEFMGVLNRLQATQRKAANTEKSSMQQMREAVLQDEESSRYNEQQTAVNAQRSMQMQRQNQINLHEIRERQGALNQLERDISDVNQIFVDLARIVHDQGEVVDSIEANVEHANIHVEQGAVNVQQAVHYQQKARQKKCMLFIFLFLLFFIILLTVYLGSK